MDTLINNFLINHPEHAARIVHSAPHETMLSIIQKYPKHIERLVSNLSPSYVANAFKVFPDAAVNQICSNIRPPYIATILRQLDDNYCHQILNSLDRHPRKAVEELLKYGPSQVGYYLEKTELLLLDNLPVHDAIDMIEQTELLTQPIFVIDNNYRFLGKVDIFSLIKSRKKQDISIRQITNKRVTAFKASTEIQNISNHPEWEKNRSIPVVGRANNFLGVISKVILSTETVEKQSEKTVSTTLDEYIYFSEMLWRILKRFWGH